MHGFGMFDVYRLTASSIEVGTTRSFRYSERPEPASPVQPMAIVLDLGSTGWSERRRSSHYMLPARVLIGGWDLKKTGIQRGEPDKGNV